MNIQTSAEVFLGWSQFEIDGVSRTNPRNTSRIQGYRNSHSDYQVTGKPTNRIYYSILARNI